MAQLRLSYREIEQTQSEVLQITHSTPAEARRYFQHYPITFPYLCDPDRVVHQRYGLPLESLRVASVVTSTLAAAADFVFRGQRTPLPLPAARYPGKDPAQAVFVVDRAGIIRAVHTFGPSDRIPSPSDLVRELALLT
jgi:AhpC/TSA family